MFKPGDKVVCIDDTNIVQRINNVRINSIYIIQAYDFDFNAIYLIGMSGAYIEKRFIKLKEYRKLKLEKLNNT